MEVDDSSRRQILQVREASRVRQPPSQTPDPSRQHLYNLPRFSLAGMAKADLGHYELFKCKGGAQLGTKECEAEVPDVTDTSASGDRDPAVYVQVRRSSASRSKHRLSRCTRAELGDAGCSPCGACSAVRLVRLLLHLWPLLLLLY